jgi:hypothetical protein
MLGQNIGRVGLPDISAGGRPSLTLDFVSIPVLNEKITFSRTSGATWFSPDGVLEGVDFSTTSVAIGTGSKTFTLAATAGANRYWAVGDLVRVSQQSNSANFMEGTVTSYTASTQVLVIDVTSTGGSGTIASWRVASHMPRFDYNPSTLAAQGLLIEEARTNSIRNNTMQDAVAGTPGTLPTNWTVTTSSGTTTNVVAVSSVAGITYVDLQVTTSGANTTGTSYVLPIEAASQIAALNGQTWTGSFWWSLVGGSFANVTAAFFDIVELDSGGSQVTSGAISVSLPTATFTRFPVTRTNSNAATAFVRPRFRFTVTNGVPVDFTLRIGLPQLELGAFATSVIPTTTTALTRAADVASVNTLSPWYNASEGTLFAEYVASNSSQNNAATAFSDGTNNNRMVIRATNASAQTAFIGVSSGSTQWAGVIATALLNTITKSAFGYKVDDIAWVRNGGTVGTDATPAVIPTVTGLKLGADGDGTLFLNGHLRRISYYPRRLSNAELQAITA